MPECDVVVCENWASFLVQLDETDFRNYCGSCLDRRRESHPGDLVVIRQL